MRVKIYEFITPYQQAMHIRAALKTEWLARNLHAGMYDAPVASDEEVDRQKVNYPLGKCTSRGTVITYITSNKFEESGATAIVHLDDNTIREMPLSSLVVIPDAEV